MRTTPISAFIALGVLILSTIFACLRTYAWSSRVLGSTANGPFTGHLRWWHSSISAVITAFALIEFALSLWIIIVLNRTYGWATHALGDQTRLLCAMSLWTAISSEIFAALVIMESTYRSRAASLLSHGVWTLVTWPCWMGGVIALSRTLTGLDHSQISVGYPTHFRALAVFGWFETVFLTLGLGYVVFRDRRERAQIKSQRNSKASLPPLSFKF